jgi:hypothetical protein
VRFNFSAVSISSIYLRSSLKFNITPMCSQKTPALFLAPDKTLVLIFRLCQIKLSSNLITNDTFLRKAKMIYSSIDSSIVNDSSNMPTKLIIRHHTNWIYCHMFKFTSMSCFCTNALPHSPPHQMLVSSKCN